MKRSDWHLVKNPIGPEDKLPPERKVVLVFVKGSYLPYCAYIRYSSGDINCPYFVVYRSDRGAEVWAWCDCLPQGPGCKKAEFYNANREGSGFPARGFDTLPTQESKMKSGINVEAGETGGHPHISVGTSAITYDKISEVLNQNKHAGSNRWLWNICEMKFTTENNGQTFESSRKTVHFKVDDEIVVSREHELTPNKIMELAGVDPKNHYLVRLCESGEESFRDKAETSIHVNQHDKFITLLMGATPVS